MLMKLDRERDMSRDIFKETRIRKNVTTCAVYNALFHHNRNKKKALVTITMGDEKLTTLFEIRKILVKEIRKLLERVKYKNDTVRYFTNIELGASRGELNRRFNPHLHVQFFYSNFKPINMALEKINEVFELSNCDIQIANKKGAYLGYVIKEYNPDTYDEEFERNKYTLAMGKPLYTNSRNSKLPNYIIKHIYNYCKKHLYYEWKALSKNKRYIFILNNIRDGKIIIKRLEEELLPFYIKVKKYQVYFKHKNLQIL